MFESEHTSVTNFAESSCFCYAPADTTMGGVFSSEFDHDAAGTGGRRDGKAADEVRWGEGWADTSFSLCCV